MPRPNALLTLYIPFNTSRHGRWRVLEGVQTVGEFTSRSESLSFALRLAGTIVGRGTVTVRLLVEEASGIWTTLPSDDFVD